MSDGNTWISVFGLVLPVFIDVRGLDIPDLRPISM